MTDPPEPTDAAAPPSKLRLSATMLGLAVVGLAIPVIGIAVAYQACVGTTIRGSVSVRGPGVEWRSALGTCTADPTALTVGLAADDGAIVVRATLDPLDGPRLELAMPAAPPITITAATCPSLRVDIRRVGQRPDGSHLLDGSAAASCRTDAGLHVELDAWWRGCHQRDDE